MRITKVLSQSFYREIQNRSSPKTNSSAKLQSHRSAAKRRRKRNFPRAKIVQRSFTVQLTMIDSMLHDRLESVKGTNRLLYLKPAAGDIRHRGTFNYCKASPR